MRGTGGYGGIGNTGGGRYLDSAEVLDLSGSVWLPLPAMSCRRAGCNAAIGPCGRLYVLGGGPDGRVQHNTMEVLDEREASGWQTDWPTCRVGRCAALMSFKPIWV